MKVTNQIFNAVASSLMWVASMTHSTYNEVNVLLYYLVIPLTWMVMLDIWLGYPATTVGLTVIWIALFICHGRSFGKWCDRVFMRSVDFLNWFNRLGGNYVLNSVVICVALPIAVYFFLMWLLM